MSVTRCLGPFVDKLQTVPRDIPSWKAVIDAVQEICPHTTCGSRKDCREICREYANMQWRIGKAKQARKARKARKAA